MSKGFYTVFRKNPSTKFVVKNVAPFGKRIRIFNYPIVNGGTRDLLSIPEISEATIRHSLLKGELVNKFRCGELKVIESDIDLLQFNDEHKSFLQSIGISNGLEVTGTGGITEIPFIFKQDIELLGVQDGSNRTFTTPDDFIEGAFGSNEFHIRVRFNGRILINDDEYLLMESGGTGTGFDTIVFVGSPPPETKHEIRVDYVTEA